MIRWEKEILINFSAFSYTGSKDVASSRSNCRCIGCGMWLLGIAINRCSGNNDDSLMVGPQNNAAYAEKRPIPGKKNMNGQY